MITGAADDDPSGVVTYAIAGARLGTSAVWMMLYLLPFMSAIQEMCVRIGVSSSCGIAGNLKRYYPKALLVFLSILIIFANTFNIGADIYGMASALQLIVPGPTVLLSWLIIAVILVLVVILPYRKIVSIFKWLAFSLFAYMVAAILVVPGWYSIILSLLIPKIIFTKDFLLLFVAIVGTTISPYLALWQTSEEAEEEQDKTINKSKNLVCKFRIFNKNDLRRAIIDTRAGMFFSNFIAFFIISLTGTLLFNAGIRNIETVKDVADALRPLAGHYSYYLFAIGIISAGLLTIPILAGSTAYVLSEIFGWSGSLDKPFSKAREFYLALVLSAVIGMAIPYMHISAVQALFFTSVINGIVAPFLIALIIHMANNPAIVGPNVNKRSANILGYATFLLIASIDIAAIFTTTIPQQAGALISNFINF